jgi:hypothetical protein
LRGRELGEGKGAFGSLDLKNRREAPFPSRGVHYLEDKMVQLICCWKGGRCSDAVCYIYIYIYKRSKTSATVAINNIIEQRAGLGLFSNKKRAVLLTCMNSSSIQLSYCHLLDYQAHRTSLVL